MGRLSNFLAAKPRNQASGHLDSVKISSFRGDLQLTPSGQAAPRAPTDPWCISSEQITPQRSRRAFVYVAPSPLLSSVATVVESVESDCCVDSSPPLSAITG